VVAPGEVPPEGGGWLPAIHGRGDLLPQLLDHGFATWNRVALQLDSGASLEDVRVRAADAGISFGVLADQATMRASVGDGLDRDARTWWLLVGLGALAALVLVAPVLTRHARMALADGATLRMLGGTSRELAGIGAGHGVAIAIASVPMVVATMIVASWFTPLGRAATLQPRPGVDLDLPVLALAVLMTLAVTAAVTAASAATAGGRDRLAALRRPTAASRVASALHLPPVLAAGGRLALEPHHRTGRVPVRSGLAGIIVAATAVVGAIAYRADVVHLQTTPRLVGWNWDDTLGLGEPTST
jgi:hypothetical protein